MSSEAPLQIANEWKRAMDDAFELCDKTVVAIAARSSGKLDLDSLTETEATVVLVYQAIGLIGNSGFAGFLSEEFTGDPGYVRTVRAFKEIGSMRAATILEKAIKFRKSIVDVNELESDESNVSHRFTILEDRFDEQIEEIMNSLSTFIKINLHG